MEDCRRSCNYTLIGSEGKYKYFTCDVCSKDKELFPTPFRQSSYYFGKGRLPTCGCYNKYRYNKQQYIIILKRKLKDEFPYIEVLDIAPDHKNRITAHCVVKLRCKEHDNIIDTYTVNRLLSVRNIRLCGDCYWEGFRSIKMLEWKLKTLDTLDTMYYNHRHILKGSLRVIKDEGKDYKVVYSCEVCSNILDKREFEILAHRFCNGKTACSCGKSYQSSISELTNFIKRTENKTYTFLGWLDSEGRPTSRKFYYWCKHHGFRHSRFWDWKSGNRCMLCSKTGFDDSKEADLYIIRWEGLGYSGIKVGITNVFKSRLANLKKNTELVPSVLYKFHFDVGLKARTLESLLKQDLSRYPSCPKHLLPDGYTETYTEDENLLNDIKEIVKKEGGYIGITEY